MAENKRFYWLKLKEEFFEDDTISFIEEQENGKEYCLFYLKLCLKSLKTQGRLFRLIGENILPYDPKSLAKVTNTDIDTVITALQLFQNIGLIKISDTKEIFMTQIEEMIGSETERAQQMREKRARDKLEGEQCSNNVHTMLPDCSPYKSKSKDIEIDKDIEVRKTATQKRFVKPTLEEVVNYCKERRNTVDANKFFDYYESNGWQVGKNKMKDWQAAVRTWERNAYGGNTQKTADERLGIAGDSQAYFDILLGNNTNNDNDDEEMPF